MADDKTFSIGDDAAIANYVVDLFQPEDSDLKHIRENSAAHGLPDIQVGVMDARHLEVIARMVGPRKIVEIGTLGGYSGLCFLRALSAPDGELFTFELEEKHASLAREHFDRAGFQGRYQIFVGPALSNLSKIESEAPFDLVFIDADKPNMPEYFEWALKHTRVGGVIIGDNTFAFGKIAEANPSERAVSLGRIREFNRLMATSPKMKSTLLPTGEGLTIGVKILE